MENNKDMRKLIYDSWNGIMNHKRNPLRHIPDLSVRHLILQLLAWMWCIVFSFYLGSIVVFGISAIAHILLIVAIVVTISTFKYAESYKDR
jgi:hypothetical protein